MEHEFKFDLGQAVQCMITGYKGVVACRTRWLTAGNTYGIQGSELHEGKPVAVEYFDEAQLIEDSSKNKIVTTPLNPPDIVTMELGNVVKDKITGCSGVLIGITDWLNGCATLRLVPQKPNENGSPMEHLNIDYNQAEFIEESGLEIKEEEPVVEEEKEETGVQNRRTGGPCRGVAARRF